MFFIILFAAFALPRTEGSMADQMAESTQLCCNQGTVYGRNHSAEDCSSSVPPDVPPNFESLCIFAMDQCCKEYFRKKIECDSGIEIATTTKSCRNTKDATKKCCDQCLSGVTIGKAKGISVCAVTVHGKNAEQFLAGDAFTECCQNAVKSDNKSKSNNDHSVTVSKKAQYIDFTSVCEDYAPNELCAHHCIPVPGSYKCECNPGFMLMPDGRNCKEVTRNRCKPHNPCQHKCIDNGVDVKCSCRRGFHLKPDGKSCEDIDECILEPSVCLPTTRCYNTLGSYKCMPLKVPKTNQERGQCPSGFAKNFANNACDDVNECQLPNPPCASYLCENTVGGYRCGGVSGDPESLAKQRPAEDRCPVGFRSGLSEECEDVDECTASLDDCNKLSQFCINTRGSFHCQDMASKHCPPGFKANPETNKCEDIDECKDGEGICRSDQICVNVLGEYDCKPKYGGRGSLDENCPNGMRNNPASNSCEDIDECIEGTHMCDQHQNCMNTNGSHECHCKSGFELDTTTGACVDINECATDQNNCIPESQRCDNTVGSFLCVRFISCGTGYILEHSSSKCEDIDECALGTHNCDRAGPQYQCVNIPGSFRCQKVTTPAPQPEYDYEYYDSEEEIDEEKSTTKNQTQKVPVSISTTIPIPVASRSSSGVTTPVNEDNIKINNIITSTETSNKIEETIDNNVDTYNENGLNKPVLNKKEFDIENSIDKTTLPDLPKENHKPSANADDTYYSPLDNRGPKYYFPTDPPNPVEPKENEKGENEIPESIPTTPEATFKPFLENPTSPKIVYVEVGKETATIKAERGEDGSVLIDTRKIIKNEWTKVNEKPTDCQLGFEIDFYGACYDIDECERDTHSCSGLTEVCRNTVGGYRCECAPNFRRELSGVCVLVTPPSTTSAATTTSTSTSTTTPAPASSSIRSSVLKYPDLRKVPSRPFRPRSFCDIGYIYNSEKETCEDVDECTNGQANCAAVEVCVNTEGGYRCECPPKWKLDPGRHRCVPARSDDRFPAGYGNEPEYPIQVQNENTGGVTGAGKHSEPSITKVDNGLVFSCPWGTILGDDNVCQDVDECLSGEAQCGPMQTCTNLHQGYTCSCRPGLRLTGDHECEDVDECAITGAAPACSQNADCVNTLGSYQCVCHDGFKAAPLAEKVCIDVDECHEARPGALCEQQCNNVWGGYRCSCHRGYRLNPDNRTCSDIDECKEYKSNNLCVGQCVNEAGSYRCACPPGYRLSEDVKSCIDINECETGAALCANSVPGAGKSEVCLNTRGGYKCHTITCPPGYRLEDKHRCTKIQTYCSPMDWDCAHQPSTYSYNFITFVSKLYIDTKVNLFTLRGPNWPMAQMRFNLRVVDVNAPPSVTEKADIHSFILTQSGNEAVTSLVKSLEGPQSIELELSMELYSRGQYGGIVVAKLFIHVSEYEF